MGTMALNTQPQLASASARDGVDTRTKDNSTETAVEVEETTRLGAGDQIRGGQSAALLFDGWLYSLMLPDYIVPPGAEVRGSAAWAAWENWLDRVGPPKTMDYGYGGFSGYDDTEDHKAVLRALAEETGPNSALFTQLYREFYNDAVASLKREVAKAREYVRGDLVTEVSLGYFKKAILRELGYCQRHLDDYQVEVLQQKFAARKLAKWFKRLPPPGVRVSETGTWIADDDDTPAKERAAFILTTWMRAKLADIANDRVWHSMHQRCQGCLENQPNQQAHMGYGGCLEEHEPCYNCGCDTSGSDYIGYCSRACRYKD